MMISVVQDMVSSKLFTMTLSRCFNRYRKDWRRELSATNRPRFVLHGDQRMLFSMFIIAEKKFVVDRNAMLSLIPN